MLTPIGNKLVVRRDPRTLPPDIANHFENGLIVIPEMAKAKSRYGKVVSVGPDVREDIRPGDGVLITWLDGSPFDDRDLGKVEVFVESEILAIVTP